ncbi:hypothetical protein [Catellatospora paridis]|uniref:hypothetical protein n=1 Tax=Catellatospora paridis TaxID=1617086 RepID=UPI0012D4BBA6|nr:hypothetical protein [Catellatospora paridis]
MSWADKPIGNDMARRAGATPTRGDFDGDFAALHQRGRRLIAEIVRLSCQLTDLQQAIGSRRGAPGRPRGSVSGGEPR